MYNVRVNTHVLGLFVAVACAFILPGKLCAQAAWQANGDNILCVPDGTSVGIGTNAPAAMLHISGASLNDVNGLLIENTEPGSWGNQGAILSLKTVNTTWSLQSDVWGGDNLLMLSNPNYSFVVLDNYRGTVSVGRNAARNSGTTLTVMDNSYLSSTKLVVQAGNAQAGNLQEWQDRSNQVLSVVDKDGNFGIGTAAPQYKLAVNGTIGTKEVIVTNSGWADYVFKPEYRLMPLTEVNTYIKANHHLPNIPSEAEVRRQGVSVGDMQAKLLAKVEELTLHVIELDKQNRALQRKVTHLEAEAHRATY